MKHSAQKYRSVGKSKHKNGSTYSFIKKVSLFIAELIFLLNYIFKKHTFKHLW